MKNLKISSKKGQIRVQEMAFMLVAVVLFFALAGLFAFSFMFSGIKKSADRIAEDRTLSSVMNLADSPEFSCGKSKPNCIDADKVIALMNNKHYDNFWPFSSLEIWRSGAFSKSKNSMAKCTFQNYPDCERFVINEKKAESEKVISTYVALCRNEVENSINFEKCEIAKIVAGFELIENK